MAPKKIAINGFGRIGRLAMRIALNEPELEVVAINDVANPEVLAYLFKYDTVYGQFKGTVEYKEDCLIVNGKKIKYLKETDPTKLPWKEMEVDYVVECTGRFTDTGDEKKDPRKHIQAGAKRVFVSAPAKQKQDVRTIVLGVNQNDYNPATDTVISNASCTTNCLAPVVKVLQDNWGIQSGLMTTIHAYTANQKMVDGPVSEAKSMVIRASRAGAVNIIPYKTGAAEAIGLVMPEVNGKLTGMAMRVPTVTGSVVDLTVVLEKPTTLKEIGAKMKAVAETPMEQGGMKGVLLYSEDPLVSADIIGEAHSSVFDFHACKALEGDPRFFKIIAWYDNEWSYARRLVDLVNIVARKD